MTETESPTPGYKINLIALVESNFKREDEIIINPEIKNNISVELEVNIEGVKIFVFETLLFDQEINGKKQVNAKIVMVGEFEKIGEPKLPISLFANINGAAIIFPFLREHLSSICLKAGVGVVLLPPINFEQLFKDKQSPNLAAS